jgi:hypothetical protein
MRHIKAKNDRKNDSKKSSWVQEETERRLRVGPVEVTKKKPGGQGAIVTNAVR